MSSAPGDWQQETHGHLGRSDEWTGSDQGSWGGVPFCRPLSIILQSGRHGDPCSWTSHEVGAVTQRGLGRDWAPEGYSPLVLVSLQTRCRPV